MKDNLKTQITAELKAGIANIKITGEISIYTEFNADNIRNIVDDFTSRGIKNAEVYINSSGGNVFEAAEIDNELAKFDNVTFYVGAMIASAATYITSNPKFKTYAKANSQVMIHRPSMTTQGNIDTIKANTKLLENLTNDYKKRYAIKTGMTESQIENLWAKGDYWMTAADALKQGFITGIVDDYNGNPTSQFYESVTAHGADSNVFNSATWTLDDYLEKDPKAYADMKISNPALAARLEQDYFGVNAANTKYAVSANSQAQVSAIDYSRASWTLDDYLDKDPQAYAQMKTTNPTLAATLEQDYFNSK